MITAHFYHKYGPFCQGSTVIIFFSFGSVIPFFFRFLNHGFGMQIFFFGSKIFFFGNTEKIPVFLELNIIYLNLFWVPLFLVPAKISVFDGLGFDFGYPVW